jgi:hypothetical protein
MEVILYILLALLILVILLVIAVVIILYQPIRLQINSLESKYKLSFAGGHIKYATVDGESGISRKIFLSEEFIPFKSLFIEEEKDKTEKKKRKPTKKQKEKKPAKTGKAAKKAGAGRDNLEKLKSILKLFYAEKELFKRIMYKTFRAALKIPRAFTVEVLQGRFYVEDPFACGIYHTLLIPFCRNRICLTPGFMDDDYLVFSMYFVPGKVVFEFVKYSLTLPFMKIFRLGWRVYRIIKS